MNDLPISQAPASDPSPDRAAVRLLEAAGAELGVAVQTFCSGWLIHLRHPDGRTRLVWGYNFDLNPSAGAHAAKDKAAAFELLRFAGVPAVEHRLFLRADLAGHVSEAGSWRGLLAALEAFGNDAVIKPVDGSGGAGVSRVRTPRELEQAAQGLWERGHAICLCPHVQIVREVRHILLDGEPRIVYAKEIDALIGDGRSTLGELLAARALGRPADWSRLAASAARQHGERAWNEVPHAGERLSLGWKHNLRGANVMMLDPPDPTLLDLAQRAAQTLGLRLCAVDVVETGRGEALVLEVNAGLMLERFVAQASGGWERSVALCRDILTRMFA